MYIPKDQIIIKPCPSAWVGSNITWSVPKPQLWYKPFTKAFTMGFTMGFITAWNGAVEKCAQNVKWNYLYFQLPSFQLTCCKGKFPRTAYFLGWPLIWQFKLSGKLSLGFKARSRNTISGGVKVFLFLRLVLLQRWVIPVNWIVSFVGYPLFTPDYMMNRNYN